MANQIAAGEVVERPAAVVKELVENSLDAGARSIRVTIRHGGKRLIRVEDDGCGMTPEEARLALERHATSKIRRAEDLHAIRSFGFRGEALPSIASVSRFRLRTRPTGADAGFELPVDGGVTGEARACGMPPGTVIEAADLFHRLPVRRRFLKTTATESARISQLCRILAAAHPEVAFSLEENGQLLFRTAAPENRRERLGALLGHHLANELWELEAEAAGGSLRLSGLISPPGVSRASRNDLCFYVNRRPVESRALHFSCLEAYQGRLPRGRFPVIFLNLEIDPALIDVNIHPSKREVRFREEGPVRQFLIEALQRELVRRAPGMADDPAGTGEAPRSTFTPVAFPGRAATAPGGRGERALDAPAVSPDQPVSLDSASGWNAADAEALMQAAEAAGSFQAAEPMAALTGSGWAWPATADRAEPQERAGAPAGWRLIGALREGLGLFETPEGLAVLHPRQARARVLYEAVLAREAAGGAVGSVGSQALLMPVPFETDPASARVLSDQLEFLRREGFELEPFGKHFFRLEGVPAWLPEETPERFLQDLADRIRESGRHPPQGEARRELLARCAARWAAERPSEGPLSEARLESLAGELLRCREPMTDPAGRPTLRLLRLDDLRRFFREGR